MNISNYLCHVVGEQPARAARLHASTIQRMLMEVLAVGSDLEWLPGGSAGVTLAIDGMSLSGS